MGPLAKKLRDLVSVVQQYEDERLAEHAKLSQSNAALKARVAELEQALADRNASIEILNTEIKQLQGNLDRARDIRPVLPQDQPREKGPVVSKPIGQGKSTAEITAMAIAAAMGNRRNG